MRGKIGGILMGKIILKTRTRVCIEGRYDITPIVETYGDWDKSKQLFISSRYKADENYTVIYVKPFERIHREVAMEHVNIPGGIAHEHEVVFYGGVPSSHHEGLASMDELTEEVIMPSKRAVDKQVTICVYSSRHEELGTAKTKFLFYVDSRCEDPDTAISRCKDEVSERLMDIVDSAKVDEFDYVRELDTLVDNIVRFIENS